jgi:hypothetical protein
MLRIGLLALAALAFAGCKKQLPSRDERCHAAADHLAKVSTATMPDHDRLRVLASCMTWTEATLDCLLDAADDAAIDRCQSTLP